MVEHLFSKQLGTGSTPVWPSLINTPRVLILFYSAKFVASASARLA